MAALDTYIAAALAENEYLRGDDCKRTRNFLLGWILSELRRGEGRAPGAAASDEERAIIAAKIEEFVTDCAPGRGADPEDLCTDDSGCDALATRIELRPDAPTDRVFCDIHAAGRDTVPLAAPIGGVHEST